MATELAKTLQAWQKQTSFPHLSDWVFARPQALGRKPYWPDAVLKRQVIPAAEHAGIAKKVGWHSFRRTFTTLLLPCGVSVKTAQGLLRHTSPQMTPGLYAKAISADKRNAQANIAALLGGTAA